MNIELITDNIYVFTFEKENSAFSTNVLVIVNEHQAIVLDTSYEKDSLFIKQYFTERGITEFVVFLSHHHEDHIDGVKAFPTSLTYGSNYFLTDFQSHLQDDNFLRNFIPNYFFEEQSYFEFGEHCIKAIHTPGHNKCGFSFFLIKHNILYVGDLFIADKENIPVIPYMDQNSNINEYLNSLNKIAQLKPQKILTGHGKIITGSIEIDKRIESYKFYLSQIRRGKRQYEECINSVMKTYRKYNFHESNSTGNH